MDHRRFLAHPEAHRPFTGGDLFARIGGRAAIDKLVDGLLRCDAQDIARFDGLSHHPARTGRIDAETIGDFADADLLAGTLGHLFEGVDDGTTANGDPLPELVHVGPRSGPRSVARGSPRDASSWRNALLRHGGG
jgi:hypothetical protein